jgi:hypothetical protein
MGAHEATAKPQSAAIEAAGRIIVGEHLAEVSW